MIGQVLSNRYKLLSELGSGGMAKVWLAEDLMEGQKVAVKVLYPRLSEDVGFLQRFNQEAKLAMDLSKSSSEMPIARILDYGADRDIHYLVMEYVEGRDLRRILDEAGPLAWQDALDVCRQVASALQRAHERGIVHRDVKPENIMISSDGRVRVLDFGVARAHTSPALTYSGFVGSPYYVAPEQAMGNRVDIRADLYSLGIVLYEMLCGELPFQSEIPWAVINHHIATPPPPLGGCRPDLPGSMEGLVRKAMAKRPDDRFQTPSEFIEGVEAVLLGLEPPSAPEAEEPAELASLLEGLYHHALQAVQAQQWRDAVDHFSQILRFDPRYRDVADQLAEAGRQARLAALYSAAKKALKGGRWAEAMVQLNEIVEVVPDYRDARELHVQVSEKHELDRLYREGVQLLEAGDRAGAVGCLERVLERDPNHTRAAELLVTIRADEQESEDLAVPVAEPSSLYGRFGRRRNLLWAVVGVLILALVVESYFFYRSKRTEPAPAVPPSATHMSLVSATPIDARSPTSVLGTSIPETGSQPTAVPGELTDVSLSETGLPKVSLTGTPTRIEVVTSTVTPTMPAATLTARARTPAAAPPRLLGQIAFPVFDPVRETYDVHVCHVDGSGCRLVAAEASQPDFLPDGTHIVVHSWKPDDKGLILWTLSGERVWRITDSLEAARPSVDFQGDAYVYHSRQLADQRAYLYRTYGAETRPFMREGGEIPGQSPSWLPDGRILYSGCLENTCGILVMDSDGLYQGQIVAGGMEMNPEASEDGQVAFMSQRDGNWEVYVVNQDGSGLRRLTNEPGNDGLPAWSPDGRYLAFVSDRDGKWAIWVMRPDGSEQRQLFPLGGSPDGVVKHAASHETHGWVEERISWGPLP